MLDWINDILSLLDKVQGLSGAGLTCAVCIGIGYGLKLVKSFPNNAIPLFVIISGGLIFALMADPKIANMPYRIWITRNVSVGCVIGCIAWGIHYWGLSYIEQWFTNKFGTKPVIEDEKPANTDSTAPKP